MAQILGANLLANTDYVLSAQVGNPFYNGSDTTAPYRIELLAGGTLLASDTGAPPAADSWALNGLTYNSGPSPALLGQPLEIRLVAVAYVDGDGFDGYEVDWDEVSLTARTTSPVPDGGAAGVLLGLSCGCLFGFAKWSRRGNFKVS